VARGSARGGVARRPGDDPGCPSQDDDRSPASRAPQSGGTGPTAPLNGCPLPLSTRVGQLRP
jgi:hypothetical protein